MTGVGVKNWLPTMWPRWWSVLIMYRKGLPPATRFSSSRNWTACFGTIGVSITMKPSSVRIAL
jgi:hypothetical protein